MAQIEEDEPALLLEKFDSKESNVLLLDESEVRPRVALNNEGGLPDSNLWYLDNGACNHMTGQRSKFKVLHE